MAFTVSSEPSEALLRAMEARVHKRSSGTVDFPPVAECMTTGKEQPAFKMSGPPPMTSTPLLAPAELQHLLAGGASAARPCVAPAPSTGLLPLDQPRPLGQPRMQQHVAAPHHPSAASTRRWSQSESPRRTALPAAAQSELRPSKVSAPSQNHGYDSLIRSERSTAQAPLTSSLPAELRNAELFMASRDTGTKSKRQPLQQETSDDGHMQSIEEGGVECETEDPEGGATSRSTDVMSAEPAAFEIGGNTFAEVAGDSVHRIPSVVTFAGVPAAQEGDLVYLGGGLYASATSPAPTRKPPRAPKQERARVMPGRVQPGKVAAVSGGAARNGRSSSQPPPTLPQIDEYGFVTETAPPPAAAPKKAEKTGPPAWKPAGATKRTSAPASEQTASQTQAASDSDCFMPLAPSRQIHDLGPGGNMEARIREREANRQDGLGLFGRKGILREIAEMQTMPVVPKRPRESLNGGPLNSDLRATERRLLKEARVQAILEERAEHEKIVSDARALGRSLPASASAPVLSAVGLNVGLGLTPTVVPDEMEKQKLRVACKMETLAFLNGYHSAVGKMTMDQKASLLATLQSSKSVKPKAALGTSLVLSEAENQRAEFNEEEDFSIHQRLLHVNEKCNEAFDFEAEL